MSGKVHFAANTIWSIIFAACLCGCSRSVDKGFDPNRNALSVEVKKILETGESFVLFSLDPALPQIPSTNTTEGFHEFHVLGKVDIKDAGERAEILHALYQGIADSTGNVAGCFNPRHGISATLDGEKVELVICFECLSMRVYTKDIHGLFTTSTPGKVFNKALAQAGIPVAEK